MSLKEYKRKRSFRHTSEPEGNGPSNLGQIFVVQKHAARRLHYDFRLQIDDTLKSWAVPKGPNLNPEVKALAVHVEDHPLDYAMFEGVIPKGQYGGGTVMVWDRGTWEPEGDALKAYQQGKLNFVLHGEKLHGAWSLVRMSGQAGDDGKNWLLIKRDDKAARKKTDILADQPRSALSGREMREIAADADRIWQSNGAASQGGRRKDRAAGRESKSRKSAGAKVVTSLQPKHLSKLSGAKRAKLPVALKPQLATLASQVPEGDGWLHEMKFDGYRLLACFENGGVRLVTRNGNDWTDRFAAVAEELLQLPLRSSILDGEIVSLNEEGLSDFQDLQNHLKRGDDQALVYYLFDVPFLEGYDLTQTPLSDRKQQLARLLLGLDPTNEGTLRYSDHIQGQGRDVLAHACRYAMEGIVSKRADSVYAQARAASWLKVKCLHRQEFVIGGFTKPSGSRIGFGALLLGYYENKRLMYAGRVGTGFTHDTLRQVRAELKKCQSDSPPFANPPRGSQARGVTWVQPKLVAEVEFTEWTDDGCLRHPSFQGLREDKLPKQIVREKPTATSKLLKRNMKSRRATSAQTASSDQDTTVSSIQITHPDRVLYPEQGLTKLELAKYYAGVADWILPHVINRPLTLVRCPRGRQGDCFFQKHLTDSLPDALRGVSIQEKGRRAIYIVVDDIAGVVALVQMGVLEIHTWGARADKLDRPDQIVFDLDPGPGVPWDKTIAAAREVRDRVEEYNLQGFVRTSGGKGLHVVVPLQPKASWDDVNAFAKSIAFALAKDQPNAYVAVASKAKRKGKIFVDYLRNSRGATSVASYSTRARPAAPVATPLRWSELSKVASADQYTVRNIARRLAALKQDPWEGFFKSRQAI